MSATSKPDSIFVRIRGQKGATTIELRRDWLDKVKSRAGRGWTDGATVIAVKAAAAWLSAEPGRYDRDRDGVYSAAVRRRAWQCIAPG